MTNVSNTCFKSQKNGMWASLLSLLENFLCLFQLITGNVNRLTGMDMGWRLHESIAKAVCTIFLHGCGCVCAQLCPILCDPMDCSLPGSSAHGILQARYWLLFPIPIPRDIPNPGLLYCRQILYHWTTREGSFSYKNAFQPRTISPLPLGHSQQYLEPFLIITTEEFYWQLLG